jgi:ABC-2 type transport system permease protein
MLGKSGPLLLVALAQTTVLFLAGKVLFHMSWGAHPWMLAPVIVATSLGLLVATTVRTDSQVTAYANLLMLVLAGISGCLMPRSWQPELMQQLGLVRPHAWALIAYDHLLSRDAPRLQVVWSCCGALLGFALACFAAAWWRFRRLE